MKVIFLKKYGAFAAGQVATIDKAKAEGLIKFKICIEVKEEQTKAGVNTEELLEGIENKGIEDVPELVKKIKPKKTE